MVRLNAEGLGEGRRPRAARVLRWAAIAALSLGATSAGAAEVAEVRVGTHEKSTRIVLELDQASGYRLVTPEGDQPELLIHLDAQSIARDVPSKSPLVRKVHVEPTGSGATVHVRLATSNVAVKELLLANPPRLVFDLTAQGPIPKAAVEEEVAAAEQTSLPEEIPSPAPAKLEEPKPTPEEPIVLAATGDPAPAESEAAAEVAPREAMPPAPVAPAAEPAEPASEPTAPPHGDEERPVLHEAAPIAPPVVPRSGDADVRRGTIPARPQHATPSGDSLLGLATSPLGLGAIGGLVLLVGVVAVMRRRRAAEDEDPLYTVMAAEDAPGVVEAEVAESSEPARSAPIWEPDAFEASEPTPKLGGPRQLALGARPAPAPEPEPEEIAPPDDSDSIFASEPEPVAAPAPAAAPVAARIAAPAPVPALAAISEETERRIAELERRIEQLAEARERLERQVAAQTEELRVQRAAIARTQRVVRSIAKTEEVATEPVPRAPSA